MMEREGLQNDDSHSTLTPDYLQYAHLGQSTPHNALFTTLSFEQLRSAAAALKGMNARAYPIIQRALQHTPTLDRAGGLIGDTPKTIYDKLNTMEGIIQDSRNATLTDERRSGVIQAAPPPSAAGTSAPMTITLPSGRQVRIE